MLANCFNVFVASKSKLLKLMPVYGGMAVNEMAPTLR